MQIRHAAECFNDVFYSVQTVASADHGIKVVWSTCISC